MASSDDWAKAGEGLLEGGLAAIPGVGSILSAVAKGIFDIFGKHAMTLGELEKTLTATIKNDIDAARAQTYADEIGAGISWYHNAFPAGMKLDEDYLSQQTALLTPYLGPDGTIWQALFALGTDDSICRRAYPSFLLGASFYLMLEISKAELDTAVAKKIQPGWAEKFIADTDTLCGFWDDTRAKLWADRQSTIQMKKSGWTSHAPGWTVTDTTTKWSADIYDATSVGPPGYQISGGSPVQGADGANQFLQAHIDSAQTAFDASMAIYDVQAAGLRKNAESWKTELASLGSAD